MTGVQTCALPIYRKEQLVVLVNNADGNREVDVSVWAAGIPLAAQLEQLIFTNEMGYSVVPVTYTISEGRLKIMLPKHSSVVLRRKDA